ncbi:hypothetical protein ACVIGA_000060 [Bradyrhizobium sp. USDA 3240]
MQPPLKRVVSIPITYSPVGRCIYCGSLGDPDLHDEHIIPDAIGGRYLLPKSTCNQCAKETHAFEGRVINRLYGDARAYLNMRRGHRRKWPKTFTILVKSADNPTVGTRLELHESLDDFTRKEIPIGDHPSPMISPNLYPAGFFFRQPMDDGHFRLESLNIAAPPDFIERVKRVAGKGNKVILGGAKSLSGDDFGRFIAKIAHSYAVATLGIGSFEPFLTNAIRNVRPMYLSHYVGSALDQVPVLPTDHQHVLTAGYAQPIGTGEKIACARVRLFAVDGFPAYDVAVGAVTEVAPGAPQAE